MPLRLLKWLAVFMAGLLALLLLVVLGLAVFGFNWARGPLEAMALKQTGRVLKIEGDLSLALAWPLPRVRAQGLRFANPAWASAPQMLHAEAVEASVDLAALLRGRLAFPDVWLVRPQVFLEQSPGPGGVLRKTWLLDRAQTDEGARIPIGRIGLDHAVASYVDAVERTAVQVSLSTVPKVSTIDAVTPAKRSLSFQASGSFRGQPLQAQGSGGPVLAWRDEAQPYPLQLTGSIGATQVQAEGTVTSLLHFSAVDVQLALKGSDLAALYPLLGVALPPTPAYSLQGRLQRSGTHWRFDAFSGLVGHSDIAGSLQLASGGARPLLTGTLASKRLDLADLGPAVGARDPAAKAKAAPAAAVRVLPELPFDTARWGSVDADVTLEAASLLRPAALPLERLQLRLRLEDRRLTLDPLNFGLAGGQLRAQVVLDGRAEPLHGQVTLQLRGVQIARLLPTLDLRGASIGRLDGDATLAGQGASVGRMLATADGRVSLVAQNGLVSRLLMEQIGLHLLEVLRLNLTGDETVPLHCAVADFTVARGVMAVRALVLDTAVNTVQGSGSVNLATETLDLRLVPRTKVSSVVALRSPIYLRGPFANPAVTLDTGRLAARGLGALALGLLNPLLALVPLFEAGPGVDSACAGLVRGAQAAVPVAGSSGAASAASSAAPSAASTAAASRPAR